MGIFVIYERIRSFRHYMLEIKYVLLHNKIRKSVVNFKERRENMQKVKRMAAKIIASILNMGLYVEANTTSCLMTYEIKAPKQLQNYRRTM